MVKLGVKASLFQPFVAPPAHVGFGKGGLDELNAI